MLTGTYSRDPSNPALTPAPPKTLPAHRASWLDAGIGPRAELAFSLAVVVLTSSAVWSISDWLLARWQLH